jgi:putative ABC transport system permease protein
MKNAASPPRLAQWLLDRFSGWGDDYGAAGDFEECYRALAAERGIRYARRSCWKQVAAEFPGYLKNAIIRSNTMLKHYFRIAIRNLLKHKGYSFINIVGLAVGMACVLFIFLWIQDEMSYDRFHADAETLYRLEQQRDTGQGVIRHFSMPYALAPILKAEIPEIQEATRIASPGSLLARSGEKAFFESRIFAVDPQIFQMFTFPLLKGDPATALNQPGSLVVTEETAQKYFGAADPMGKAVTINDAHAFTITGVMKNIPTNSSLSFDMLVPFDFVKTLGQYNGSLMGNDIMTFVRLQPRSDLTAAGQKITRLVNSRTMAEIRANPEISKHFENNPELHRRFESRLFLFRRLIDINLFDDRQAIRNVYTYSALALFILLIACLNFMSLATARSANRAKEVGLRRVVGARRKSLVGQFYGESILTAFLAGTASLLLVILLLPAFKSLFDKTMSLDALWSGKFLLGMLVVILVTGIVAGSYPALFLSSFRPVNVLHGRLGGAKGSLFRKTMVLLQFGLSVLFLIGLGVVLHQVDYMRMKKLGYDKEQMIYLPMRDKVPLSYAVFKEQLLRNPRILGVTATRHPPTSITASDTYADWDGKDPEVRFRISFASVDFDFPETMKIEMAAGRPFSRTVASDIRRAFLVNEDVPKLMGLDAVSAVGRRFLFWGYEGTIVGVMKNFHYQSVRYAIGPLAVVVDPKEFCYAVVRLTGGEIPASLEDVKKIWRQVFPQYPVEYRFFDEDFDQMYRQDERMGKFLKVFSALAVFIACMGLFGLASYTAERRTKEIGIRKVLGASSSGIVLLLSGEFAKWVLAANLIAWPAGYFLMRKWLQQFAYNAGIAWWLFAAAGAGALAIALMTVSFQAVRAAHADPVKALKYE